MFEAITLPVAEPTGLSDRETLAGLANIQHLRNLLDAVELKHYNHFDSLRPEREAKKHASDEVATELRLGRGYTARRMSLAQLLPAEYPATWRALQAAEIDLYKAEIIKDETRNLPAELVHKVEQQVLVKAPRQTGAQLRAAVKKTVLALDPRSGDERHVDARTKRHVALTPYEDGMAGLWLFLPADKALAMYGMADAYARTCKTPGDTRTFEQRRADAFVDLMLNPDRKVNIDVQVEVPYTALLGDIGLPANLPGYGPVPDVLARAAAAEGTWRRILTDPLSGTILDVGRTRYRPPEDLADHVRVRDKTCTHPGCLMPAAKCDLDHLEPYPKGTTSAMNLGPSCHHHRVKTLAGWKVRQPRPGFFVFTSPAGIQYLECPGSDPPPAPPPPENDEPPF